MVNENKLVPTNVFVVNLSNYIFPSLIVFKKKLFLNTWQSAIVYDQIL